MIYSLFVPLKAIMGRAIDKDLKERIVLNYNIDNMTMDAIAQLQWVSIGLVSKVLRLHRLYGQVTDPFSRRTGRKSGLHRDDLLYMEAILEANPSLYLDKIQDKLASIRSVDVSIATIARALQHLDLNNESSSPA
jgi:transposase